MFAGHIDHAARVMRVITWNRSFKGAPNGDGAKDDYAPEDYETHATVLDKLLAWEKKLYEEVKVCCCFLIIRVILRFPSHSKGTLHIKGINSLHSCHFFLWGNYMELIHCESYTFYAIFCHSKATFLLLPAPMIWIQDACFMT